MAANESEEEDDYMSDAILLQCGDARPGLVKNNKHVRAVEMEKKHELAKMQHRQKYKPMKQRESEKREEGLQSALKPDNKGFAMLQKMGYKPGMSIGKKGEGIVQPISIQLKDGRGGLGRETDLEGKRKVREEFHKLMAAKRQRMDELDRGEFRDRKRYEMFMKHARRDLEKSQNICEQLDKDSGWERPVMVWHWPAPAPAVTGSDETSAGDVDDHDEAVATTSANGPLAEDDNDDDTEQTDTDEQVQHKLQTLTEYLRDTYFYCVWCAVRYNDAEDLGANCPGNTSEDHR